MHIQWLNHQFRQPIFRPHRPICVFSEAVVEVGWDVGWDHWCREAEIQSRSLGLGKKYGTWDEISGLLFYRIGKAQEWIYFTGLIVIFFGLSPSKLAFFRMSPPKSPAFFTQNHLEDLDDGHYFHHWTRKWGLLAWYKALLTWPPIRPCFTRPKSAHLRRSGTHSGSSESLRQPEICLFLARPTFHEFSYAMAPLVSWPIFWSCTTSWFIQVAPLDQCQVSLDTAKLYPKRAQGSTADHVWDTQWADAGSSACLKGHFFFKASQMLNANGKLWQPLVLAELSACIEKERVFKSCFEHTLGPWVLCLKMTETNLQRTAG